MLTNPNRVVERSIFNAFLTGVEEYGSCIFCETDFSVLASSDIVRVRVWQRLGSETSFSKKQIVEVADTIGR
ncbi:hypothetical protein V8C42DRAFT_304223 [Trichoderma barbatum]